MPLMSRQRAEPDEAGVVTIYCPQCGQPMRVAGRHIEGEVACPHCGTHIDPWRFARASEPYRSPERPCPPRQPADPAELSDRSRLTAGLLGIFLGGFGAHRFYLGSIGIGLLQLVLFPISHGASTIWGFIEGILCLTGKMRDANGRPLRD